MSKPRLSKEITLVICLKLLALTLLWTLCFSHPEKAHINPAAVSEHLLGFTT